MRAAENIIQPVERSERQEQEHTTMSEAADQAADTATGEAVKAHLTGGTEKSAPLFDKAAVAHRRAEQSATLSDGWRDGTEVAPLAPMPEAPTMHEQEASNAIQKLQTIDGGNELVESWGSDFKSNLSYARAAFQEIATPELIAKFDASGLGNDPAILEHLAKHGRLNAGFTGIDPVAQYQPSFT